MPGPPPCRYCNLSFHYCREGTCPSAAHCLYCPLLPLGRPCRGSIHAARPTFPSQPLVPITIHRHNIHLAQKSLSKFVKKSEKTVDKSHTPCYNNQAVSRRTRREKRFITACICFLKKFSLKNAYKLLIEGLAAASAAGQLDYYSKWSYFCQWGFSVFLTNFERNFWARCMLGICWAIHPICRGGCLHPPGRTAW